MDARKEMTRLEHGVLANEAGGDFGVNQKIQRKKRHVRVLAARQCINTPSLTVYKALGIFGNE